MAEIGGSPTEDAMVNLDSSGNDPGTSNGPKKEGSLKRTADADNAPVASNIKKKKTAEERASCTRGRNQAIKKAMREEKKKEKEKEEKESRMDKLLEYRDKLLDRLQELEERDMEVNDQKEKKALEKEEDFRGYLIKCENAIKALGNIDFSANDEMMMQSVAITIPDWSCLDTHVQDFAFERFSTNNPDHCMTMRQLTDIIKKVKPNNPTVKFPKEQTDGIDRLLSAINWKIRDAAQLRRWKILEKNLEEYPGVEADSLPLVKTEIDEGEERGALQNLINNVVPDGASDKEIDVINLDDEESVEVEGDDDEVEDEGEVEGNDDNNEESESKGFDNMEEDCPEMEVVNTLMEPPEVESKEEETTKKEDESMDVKTKEENDRSDSKDEKSEEEEKEVRPDSREGKDTLEGGTSTNSPTTERDERMKSMEKTDNNVKQEVIPMEHDSPREITENGDNKDGPELPNPMIERKVVVVAQTIVLDDDEDGMEVQEMKVIPSRRDTGLSSLENKRDDTPNGPPVPPKMNATEAWHLKLKQIQEWVDKLSPASPEENEKAQTLRRDNEDEEADDGIECLQDDFEFDSVSHSGLEFRKKLKDQPEGKSVKIEKNGDGVSVIELD
uniref:Uncharacterized protein n=1 Tax=Pristionchus pacificus TaxID=54126 RepID=A0A8R1UEW7_PRIPA